MRNGRKGMLLLLKFPIKDPWDERYIYLHEWLVFYGKCRDIYQSHGWYGFFNKTNGGKMTRVEDRNRIWLTFGFLLVEFQSIFMFRVFINSKQANSLS